MHQLQCFLASVNKLHIVYLELYNMLDLIDKIV